MTGSRFSFDLNKPLGIVLLVMTLIIAFAIQYKIFDFRSRAQYVPANLVIDASVSFPNLITPDFMLAFAQGGEEKRNMLAPAGNLISDLKPKAIRIDHVYDYFVVINRVDNKLTYDFSQLDEVIKTITDTGAVPVLSLGYMPLVFSEDGTVTGKPRNWQEWQDLIKNTVEHLSGKDGLNINGIYYEVWNEPDLEQFGHWKTYGEKNYIDLYRHTLEGAKPAKNVNNFFIGGPATAKYYKAWTEALIKSGLRVDFFSWHSYGFDPEETVSGIQSFKSLISGNPEYHQAQILITESGFSSSKDERYNTGFAAAYSGALFRKLLDNPPKHIFTFELTDGPDGGNDGWGLLSHESKGLTPKPRYNLFKFLGNFPGQRLGVDGEGTFVTCTAVRSENQIRILITNYRYDQENTENTPVRITGLENGTYQIRKTYLNNQTQEEFVTVSDNNASFSVIMPDKSVLYITITKQ